MKTIEINTAQKVAIQYELATLGNRFVAYFIDIMIVTGVITLLSVLSNGFYNSSTGFMNFLYLVIIPVPVFYSLVSEISLHGQTIGKKVIGLKVVKLNGDAPSNQDFLMRWMFRFIDIFMSLGSVGVMLITASPKSQRLGGLLSGTTVIRTTAQRTFSLNDILKISTIDNYKPTYPQIRRFSEKDMLFIKKVLERTRKHPNEAHKKIVSELSKHVAHQLKIRQLPKDHNKFLRTLINDYIVLTR